MMTTIKVTKAHILKGVRYKTTRCPIALAIRPHIHKDYSFLVSPGILFILNKDGQHNIKLPASANTFMGTFDHSIGKDRVKPITFKLNIPKKFLK